jgi:hypothetical protein
MILCTTLDNPRYEGETLVGIGVYKGVNAFYINRAYLNMCKWMEANGGYSFGYSHCMNEDGTRLVCPLSLQTQCYLVHQWRKTRKPDLDYGMEDKIPA